MKIKINEINRDKKLLFQQNAPAKFMYNGKPIRLAPLGNEAVSEYTEECHSRWQPEYTQLKPSHIYANWFNPMIIKKSDFSTDVANNCRKWSLQWTNRKTIESDLILDESQSNTSINIVRLLNSNTLDNPESSNKMVYLNTTADLRTNKWESLSPSPYACGGMVTGGNGLSSDYPIAYRDIMYSTGYSICKEFLNNYNFSISVTVCGRSIWDDGYIVRDIPIVSLPIYTSDHQLLNVLKIYAKRRWQTSSSDSYYTYGEFMKNPVYPSGGSKADTHISDEKFYTNITDSPEDLPVSIVNAQNLSNYWVSDVLQPAIEDICYPIINFIVTYNGSNLSLYVNGLKYSSVDISTYIQQGCYFFDADLIVSRQVELNSDGSIATQTISSSFWGKTNNINVFSECLNDKDVFDVFKVCTKHLSSPYWGTSYQYKEYPYELEEITPPQTRYTIGSEFNPGSALYTVSWGMTTISGTFIKTRTEPVVYDIVWFIQNPEVFDTGGTTTVLATYTNGTLTLERQYSIVVTNNAPFVLTKLNAQHEPTGEVYRYMYEDLATVVELLTPADNLWDVQILDVFNDGIIPNSMFKSCAGLYSISICEGFHTIEQSAFYYCSNLTEAHLPTTLLDLQGGVFSGTPLYTSDSIVSVDGWLIKYTGATGAITLPEGTVGMVRGLFNANKNITSVQLPDTVRSIPYNTFYNCTKLASINIPKDIVYIGPNAFYGCIFTSITVNTHQPCNVDPSSFNFKVVTLNIGDNCTYVDPSFLSMTYLKTYTIDENNTSYNVLNNVLYNKSNTQLVRIPKRTTITSISAPNTVTELLESCAEGCTTITSISGTENVTVINDKAFYGCKALVTLPLGNNITYIGTQAFYDCNKWTSSLNLSSITYLGSEAFKNCWVLGDVTLGNNLTSILSGTFYACRNMSHINLDNIESFGSEAFRNCIALTSTTMSDNTTELADYLFAGCTSLQTVHLSTNLTTINNHSFDGCTALTTANIHNNVIHIQDYAFNNCSVLSNIVIPTELQTLGQYAFCNCANITSAFVPHNITILQSSVFKGCSGITEFSIPNHVTTLRSYCLSGTSITSIIIPNTVTYIDTGIFKDCTLLSDVTLPDVLSEVTFELFQNCTSLQQITIPNTVQYLRREAFSGCTQLVTLNCTWENLTSIIGSDVFNSCTSLAELDLSRSAIPEIETRMFQNCTSLTSILLPSTVKDFGEEAFQNCTSLTSMDISNATYVRDNCFDGCINLETVTFSNTMTSLGNYAFQNCTKLRSIYIPTTLTSIRVGVFKGCASLTTVSIPNSITSIGTNAFEDCTNIQTISMSSKVTTIGEYAFNNCSSLKSITLYSTLTTLGSYAFHDCASLTSITVPSKVTSLSSYVFAGCSNLETISINGSITRIYDYAFYNCYKLKSINIPSTVTNIGEGAFQNCQTLTTVTIPAATTTLGSYIFRNCISLTAINVNTSNTKYSSVDGVLCNYAKTELREYPIGNTRTDYTIPNTITSILSYAFAYCSNLITVTIPASVTTLGNYLFRNCSSLTSIYVDAGNTKFSSVEGVLCNYAKTQLREYPIGNTQSEYTIPNTITSVVNYAFAYCSNLVTVNIPSSVTTMPAYVFRYSTNLSEINVDKPVDGLANSPWGAAEATINWLRS